jgi:hypothetical protein
MVDNPDPREEYIQRWHTYLKSSENRDGKTPQKSLSTTSFLTAVCFSLAFLLNSIIFNGKIFHPQISHSSFFYLKLSQDRLSRCYFIQSTIFTLVCFIYYYPTQSLTFYGTVHYRVIKWIFIITITSTILFQIRTRK